MADAGVAADGSADVAVLRDDDVASFRRTASEVRDLIAGRLDPETDPASLFEAPLDDERRVALDAARIEILLADAGARPHARKVVVDAAAESFRTAEPALWDARRALDEARLAFYTLGVAERTERLDEHAVQREAARAAKPESDAERRKRESEEEQKKALDAARRARNEAERAVAQERARLLGVEQAQAAYATKLDANVAAMKERREASIGWAQRAREAGAAPGTAEVDRTYEELRKTVRRARSDLSVLLDRLADDASTVPSAGKDPLVDLPVDVDTKTVREERARVDRGAVALRERESTLEDAEADALVDEIDRLNAERLAMLDILTAAKRDEIVGFGPAGRDQAAAEVTQLTLIARYQKHEIGAWLVRVREPGRSIVGLFGSSALVLLGWMAVFVAFLWWRRRAVRVLVAWLDRTAKRDREERRTAPSALTRVLGFLVQVRSPLEWLALLLALGWLLPQSIRTVLEVELLSTTLEWVFAGGLVVDAINAVAGGAAPSVAITELGSERLRLRSLRLVGRIVVVLGLVLVLSARLVGRGTIYRWVSSTCWLLAAPVFLLLVRWWRDVAFQRIEAKRKKTSFERWVLANRTGWTSFFAATTGGVYLFATGTQRAFRSWVGRFTLTRRVLAYLFRRQLDKRGADRRFQHVSPLADATFAALGPETPSRAWIPTDADDALKKLVSRFDGPHGGVVAVVGERGMGKTRALDWLSAHAERVVQVSARGPDTAYLARAIATSVGIAETASLEAVAAALERMAERHAIVIDDAQRFVLPVMGGLATLDALLAVASHHGTRTTWVLAFDQVIWQFLERARGARPLFDEVIRLHPWSEESISRLVRARTEQAGIAPSYAPLTDPLPAGSDEVDRTEALEASAQRYHRLLWDNADGNPGVVLHMWRRSLGVVEDGEIEVEVSEALDVADLERLPDSAVFVLRAVLQLAPADREQISRATMLSRSVVDDAIRYGIGRGYLEVVRAAPPALESYRVTWTWFRAMTSFLLRRHLLIAG